MGTIIDTFRMVGLGGLYNRISDEDLGGSSLTALNSFSNLGGQFSNQISLFLLSSISYDILVAVGLLKSILFVIVASKLFIPL
jgi:Acetyl-coenzyme A transporter 1